VAVTVCVLLSEYVWKSGGEERREAGRVCKRVEERRQQREDGGRRDGEERGGRKVGGNDVLGG
jgi:hypothetical protein